jgi:hypothetical protein
VQGKQQFPAGNVLEPADGLNPVPMFAQLSGNMGPASVPVFFDHCLDNGKIFGGNFAVSDNQRFHGIVYSRKKKLTSALNASKQERII